MYCHYSASLQCKVVSSQLLTLKLDQNPLTSQVIDDGKLTKLKLGEVFKLTNVEEGDAFKVTKVEDGDVLRATSVNVGDAFKVTLEKAIISLPVYLYHNLLVILLVVIDTIYIFVLL